MIARLAALVLLAGVGLVLVVVTTQEPTDAGAVTALLFGLGVVAFGLATPLFYYAAPRRRRKAGVAVRRGLLVGLAVGALAFLRALGALQPITAVFLLAAVAALEGVLSARA